MRTLIAVCLLLLFTGCVAIQSGKQTPQDNDGLFHDALGQLLQNNNSKPMKDFINQHPDDMFINDAKQILTLYSAANNCRGEVKKCDKQLKDSHQELKKLHEDIDRLTELSLEMDRSSP